jgi:transposase-like protein
MSKVNRNEPKRSKASESQYTIFEFDREYPDDAACLEKLVAQFYPDGIFCPKCDKVTKHFRETNRPSYACEFCGHHEHPLVGTIFEGSSTSLRLWFYAMFLMTSTRCGISAKQLERELGVTYKCAWRMFNKIRSLMGTDETFEGTVELDEMYVGGKAKNMHRERRQRVITGRGPSGKTPVFGMAQRKTEEGHGRVMAKVVQATDADTLLTHVETKVLPRSMVYTDEYAAYNKLGEKGYAHSRVAHAQEVYVIGDVHTNTIEGFWSLTKRGIDGVYHSVSDKWLQSYLDEYSFRYNSRDTDGRGIFTALLDRVVNALPSTPEASSESG